MLSERFPQLPRFIGGPIVYFASQPQQAAERSAMNLSNTTLSVLVVLALALAIFAALPMVRPGLRDLRRRRSRAVPADRRLDVLIDAQAKAIQRLEGAVKKLAQGERELGELTGDAVRHVGVVRFDAFEDMGGRLSFSAALLDGHGEPFVCREEDGLRSLRDLC